MTALQLDGSEKLIRQKSKILILVCLVGLGVLGYYGYCFGLWGRNSLLLQYLFQCKCPAFSEEMRYSKYVDVIVSACQDGSVTLSTSGRFLYVRKERFGFTSDYLLDTQTNDKVPVSLPRGGVYFLTDDLIYIFVLYGHGYEGGEHIFDRTTSTMYPLQKFTKLYPDAYVNGDANLFMLAENLRFAKDVYYIEDNRTVIAFPSDFHAFPEQAFLTGRFDIPYDGDVNRVEPFLQENNIAYLLIRSNFPGEVLSPDGRFIARNDGIYLNETNQLIINSYNSGVRGWIHDSSGAVYDPYYSGPCLIRTNFGFMDDYGCFFEVRRPVLLLKVPEKYRSPAETP